MAYKITDKCIACGACAAECPVGCIAQGEDKFVIDKSACISSIFIFPILALESMCHIAVFFSIVPTFIIYLIIRWKKTKNVYSGS